MSPKEKIAFLVLKGWILHKIDNKDEMIEHLSQAIQINSISNFELRWRVGVSTI